MRSKFFIVACLLVALLVSTAALIALADHGPAGSHLAAVGPVSQANGYPVWYRDANGLTLELCLETNGLCLIELPDPNAPLSFPDNFPDEAFWWAADSTMITPGGDALLVLADEAAFANELVIPGDQVAFGRVRIRVDITQAGTYTVTHPFGQDVFEGVVPGTRAINFSEDIGDFTPAGEGGDFGRVLDSRVGPFLTWDSTAPAPPDGYIGDAATPHQVEGSVFIDPLTSQPQNFFRIEGPVGAFTGSPDTAACPAAAGPDPIATSDCIQTNLFVVQGKISTIAGVEVKKAVYSTDGSNGSVDVFAVSENFEAIHASGAGLNTTALTGDGAGRYFARLDYTGSSPASLTVTNVGDNPPSAAVVDLVDLVIIKDAIFNTATGNLAIEATSSDTSGTPPTLTAFFEDGTTPVSTTNTLNASGNLVVQVAVPPAKVVVKSTAGGSDVQEVEVVGGGAAPIPVTAEAGPPQAVVQGVQVTVDGSNSAGTPPLTFAWAQSGGPVAIPGLPTSASSDPTFTFTAPATAGVYTLTLTVSGPTGTDTDDVAIEVLPLAPPLADAGPDQTVVQGALVTLDGSASENAATFSWAQIGGTPTVTLNGANTANPTFTFPNANTTLTFELTVTGPGGPPSTDQVIVTSVDDVLTVTRARVRTGSAEWRVEGTATVTGTNVITIHTGSTLAGPVLGTAAVDPLDGTWRFRQRPSPTPASATISIESSAGGQLLAVPVQITN